MKRPRLIKLIAIIFVVFALCGGLIIKPAHAAVKFQFVENQITSNSANQENPDIYEYGLNNYAIVWQDNRNGKWDIYMLYQKDLGNGNWDVRPEIRLTSQGNNENPKIYNDTIVYQSDQNGNWDIYMYNVTSGVETQITDNPYAQMSPKIEGNNIVWEDNRNGKWDVYMYDLTTQTEKQITTSGSDSIDPSISGNRIVYIRHVVYSSDFTRPYIYYYDLSTGVEVQLADSTNSFRYAHVAIDGTCVAWTQLQIGLFVNSYDSYDIRMKDIITGKEWLTSTGNQEHADISVASPYTYITYDDTRNGNYEIYVYELSNGVESRVTNNTATQNNPAISTGNANFIAYSDNRNGNWDIYLTTFWSAGLVSVGGGHSPTSSPTNAAITNSGNQGLMTIIIIATTFVVIAIAVLAAFMAMKQRKSRKPNN